MGFVSAVPDQVNVTQIRNGGIWGVLHETGHNHQWDSWTISATTDTGCNWWSLFVNQNVNTYNFKLTMTILKKFWLDVSLKFKNDKKELIKNSLQKLFVEILNLLYSL